MRWTGLGMAAALGWLGMVGLMVTGYGVQVAAAQANPMRAPTVAKAAIAAPPTRSDTAFPAVVFDAYLQFFQRVISPVDGARSNMYPTGSAYARQALSKHGALLGIVLTTERLLHEGNEGQLAPRIRKYGLWRVYDPVAANDWWWQAPDWVYRPDPPFLRR